MAVVAPMMIYAAASASMGHLLDPDVPAADFAILLESSDDLLLESGDAILKE